MTTLKQERGSNAPPLLLDVRAISEWNDGHVGGVPLGELPNAMASRDKDRPIAVMCGSGYRSSIACSLMHRSGFQDVSNVVGGWGAWKEAESRATGAAATPSAAP